jgi:tetratricopeptide (TPR) repeat protein
MFNRIIANFKRLLLWITVVVLAPQIGLSEIDQNRTWSNAVSAYENAEFESAAQSFEELLNNNVHTIPLWYNLGTSYAQQERYYEALWLLRRVLTYDPAHSGANRNLLWVNKQLGTKRAGHSTSLDAIQKRLGFSLSSAIGTYPTKYRVLFYSFCLIFLGITAFLLRNSGRKLLRYAIITIGVMLISLLLYDYLSESGYVQADYATVIDPTEIYSGPDSEKFNQIGTLEAGKLVELSRNQRKHGFLKINLTGGGTGFVTKTDVRPHRIDLSQNE